MSSEQITQETVPVETTTTETVQPTATPTPVAKADTPAPQTSWKDSISEEYRADPNIEKFLKELQNNYKFIFGTDEGKEVLSDLEKRCHYHSTTNVKGDSHESAYMEGQRSVILFIKSMLQNNKDK